MNDLREALDAHEPSVTRGDWHCLCGWVGLSIGQFQDHREQAVRAALAAPAASPERDAVVEAAKAWAAEIDGWDYAHDVTHTALWAAVKAMQRDESGPPLCPRCPHPFHEYDQCPDCACRLRAAEASDGR